MVMSVLFQYLEDQMSGFQVRANNVSSIIKMAATTQSQGHLGDIPGQGVLHS